MGEGNTATARDAAAREAAGRWMHELDVLEITPVLIAMGVGTTHRPVHKYGTDASLRFAKLNAAQQQRALEIVRDLRLDGNMGLFQDLATTVFRYLTEEPDAHLLMRGQSVFVEELVPIVEGAGKVEVHVDRDYLRGAVLIVRDGRPVTCDLVGERVPWENAGCPDDCWHKLLIALWLLRDA